MGMDVFGNNPTSEVGNYFRNTCWAWPPLAEYVCKVAPEITRCTDWQSNDGDGLSEDNSRILADILQNEINSGRTETYAQRRRSELEMMPSERCGLCAQNVQRFTSFLRACGGFEIW